MSGISLERWHEAQIAEQKHHINSKQNLLSIYEHSYSQYFKWLDIEHDLKGKRIIEIGCAHIPALLFCSNYEGVIIEPMPSDILLELTETMPVELIREPAEYVDLSGYNEVWLFNVLQHVIDPELLINNMKKSANIIRYFEPVNMETCVHHPHGFTMDDFKKWFDDARYYPNKPDTKNFHTHECGYGIWRKAI
jgi:hypothetical protein